jgi:filamentous hemagglutinin
VKKGLKKVAKFKFAKKINWAKISGILRDAKTGKGNFGLGSASIDEALIAGEAWVGKGYTVTGNGKIWLSADGLRQFRLPSLKPKLGIEQANFEWRNIAKGGWQGNGHLDIVK